MLVTPAFAQATGAAAGNSSEFVFSLLPFVLIFVIMYFLIIRPQRQRMKTQQAMIAALKRGDTVITSGGMIGKITKVVDDNEIQVELAENVRIRVLRSAVTEVRAKGEPVAATVEKGGA